MTNRGLGSINALLVTDIEITFLSLLKLKVQYEFYDGRLIWYSWGNSDEIILKLVM